MIVLDTDVVIDLLRKYIPAVDWLDSLENERIALPGFVAMQLIQGCRNRKEIDKLEEYLHTFRLVWPFPETCDQALSTFSQFHLSHGLGLLDALIGQIAVA
ncbi:MAG: type II toxin-antitoxin system VapC family toxin, partial [Proteobacteria bacterium]|nr:type II toxin-antitoxin system VapC family toxin [Pseudomonadota bacterium]